MNIPVPKPIVLGKGLFVRTMEKLRNPNKTLKQIGVYIVGKAQKAFDAQRFGEYKWSVRYPKQSAPKINVAGVVSDLAAGKPINQRRFEDKPALKDTGNLYRSLVPAKAITVMGRTTVLVGSSLAYAGAHQFGGIPSSQVITKEMRAKLGKFLKSKRGKQYRPKLGFLFQRKSLTTRPGQRPFLGITDPMKKEIKMIIEGNVPYE